jgi:hypothetical protein
MSKLSRGIEKVIALAALDPAFKKKLLNDREAAIDSCDIILSENERKILLAIPDAQLVKAVKKVHVPVKARRMFLTGAVAAALTLVIGTCVTFILPSTVGIRAGHPFYAKHYMREIVFAQRNFKEAKGRYASSIKELIDAGIISKEWIKSRTKDIPYKFELYEADKDSFKLRAIPEEEGEPYIYADETGVIKKELNTEDTGR